MELYSNSLIDKVARESASLATVAPLERSRELLQKLENRIESDEAAFDTFLSVLARDPTMEDIHTNLRAAKGIRHSVCSLAQIVYTHTLDSGRLFNL